MARTRRNRRFPDTDKAEVEVRNQQLDFELRSLILSSCAELTKKGMRLDSVRTPITTPLTAISAIPLCNGVISLRNLHSYSMKHKCPGSETGWAMPDVFEKFRTNRFNLVWRGSRDGVTTNKSRRRCEGRVNTLTLISDTDWKVFGDFTPVECKSDHSYSP
jgi:hypothetical protein